MTWKGCKKKMQWVNREMFHAMMNNQEDERWIRAVNAWNNAHEALATLEELVKEWEEAD